MKLNAKPPTAKQLAAVLEFCKPSRELYETLLSRCEAYRRAGKFPAFGKLKKELKLTIPDEGVCGGCGKEISYGHWRINDVTKGAAK